MNIYVHDLFFYFLRPPLERGPRSQNAESAGTPCYVCYALKAGWLGLMTCPPPRFSSSQYESPGSTSHVSHGQLGVRLKKLESPALER